MGTPTPPPPVVGDNCAHCDGTLWPAGKTPRFIKLTGEGFEKCPLGDYEPPNDVFYLEQVDGLPCDWRYEDEIHYWEIWVDADGHIEGGQKRDAGGWRWSFGADWNNCDTVYNNNFVVCNLNGYKNGKVTLEFV